MSGSYGRLQSLVHPTSSTFTQQSKISQFNTGGCGRCGRGRDRGYRGIGYDRGRSHGHGGRGVHG